MRVGIGFATGRKGFQKVLSTNIYNWRDSGLVADNDVHLNLFVAYDLEYNNTKRTDYTNVNNDLQEQLDDSTFIGKTAMRLEIDRLVHAGVINEEEGSLLFRKGYAAKRNMVLYHAIKQQMDCLIFLDDDEYPMAVTNTKQTAVWSGQHVLAIHLQNIIGADMTHGHHCGYISPIPYIEFNDVMSEDVFKGFIEAISNDIINWENMKSVMQNGGITYADVDVLTTKTPFEVQESKGAKFISGANLCINLKDCTRIFPFYNPPGARGEDTFLSTCLSERKVVRVPCYTFHDGFLTYHHLLEGMLPIKLKFIRADDDAVIGRFYRACIGWIRYKPLLTYITEPAMFGERMAEMRAKLTETLPIVARFFNTPDFMNIMTEFEKYQRNVPKHFAEFQATQKAWKRIMDYFA